MNRFARWREERRRRADARYPRPAYGSITMPGARLIPIGEPVTEIPHALLCGRGCPCRDKGVDIGVDRTGRDNGGPHAPQG